MEFTKLKQVFWFVIDLIAFLLLLIQMVYSDPLTNISPETKSTTYMFVSIIFIAFNLLFIGLLFGIDNDVESVTAFISGYNSVLIILQIISFFYPVFIIDIFYAIVITAITGVYLLWKYLEKKGEAHPLYLIIFIAFIFFIFTFKFGWW